MSSIGDYNEIMSDHNLFNKVVYTPLSEALKVLDERQKDPILMAKIEKLLNGDIPDLIKMSNKSAVLLRQVATPNFEIRLFASIAKENDLHPIICEYLDDKFTSNNNYKHSLGQLPIQKKLDKNGNFCVEKHSIVDFNKYNGKKFRDVLTFWNQPLVDFHKQIFNIYFKGEKITVWDGSDWYKKKGINKNVTDHYKNLFLFFVSNGILFENFLTSKDSEGNFTREIVLPTIDNIIKLTGVKPLIVPIPPMDMETEDYWYHHLPIMMNYIPKTKI